MSKSYVRNCCRMCESKNLKKIIAIPSTPVGDHYVTSALVGVEQPLYPLDLYVCEDCYQIQLLSVVDPDIIYADYIYETASSRGLKQHFERYAEQIIADWEIQKNSKVLDIGCNDGTMLAALKSYGMQVLGVEPAAAIAKKNNNRGLETIVGYFGKELSADIKKKYGSMEIIFANNVTANIDDLKIFFEAVRDLLSEEGIFVLESGYAVDLINKYVLDNIYHEHYSYFSLSPLMRLFERVGLQIIDVYHAETKGGSLRIVSQRKGAKRAVKASVEKQRQLEIAQGFNDFAKYEQFAERFYTLKKELHALLAEYKDQGKVIAGYGASVGVTTLLYFFDLANYISVLFDDNPAKQNTFSPGYHIPVLSSDEIYNKNVDVIVIFAWRYAEPIMNRHRSFIENGCEFLIPMPEITKIADTFLI